MADTKDQVVPEFSFPVFCEFQGKDGRPVEAVERTFWGASNSGRRYFSCRYSMSTDVTKRGCTMFVWKDGGASAHYRNMLNSLSQEITRYYVPISSIVDLEDEIEALNAEKTFLIRDKEQLCKKVGDLEGIIYDDRAKMAKMKTEIYWWKLVCVALVIGFFAISVSRVV